MKRTKYAVRWARAAVRDLQHIVDYIASDNLAMAKKVASHLEKRAQGLSSSPERGRIIPELLALNIRSYRELIITPYRLMYRITEDRVLMIALFDGRRDLESVLLHRLTESPFK